MFLPSFPVFSFSLSVALLNVRPTVRPRPRRLTHEGRKQSSSSAAAQQLGGGVRKFKPATTTTTTLLSAARQAAVETQMGTFEAVLSMIPSR